MRTLVVLGTRPEAIKLAPVIEELRTRSDETVVCLTGQHKEMVEQVVAFFRVAVDYRLDLMTTNQSLVDLSTGALAGTARVIREVRPDWVVVQGDTTTAFAAALAAFYERVRVAHVEAGLRSHDLASPWPEEANRVLLARVAALHLAPTPRARDALLAEGTPAQTVHVTGNTVIDALQRGLQHVAERDLGREFRARLARVSWERPLILVTGHRRESFGAPFESICRALRELALTEDVEIVYPVHLNPNVRKPVGEILKGVERVHLLDPVEYPMLLWLMQQSRIILTDSGGIQEEAPSLGKPVVVMRDVTERRESVDAGVSVLAGTKTDRILREVRLLLHDEAHYRRMSRRLSLYGDGTAARKIADLLAA